MSKRSIVYVDGFNLYKGALEEHKRRHSADPRYQHPIWKGYYKWLNLQAYFALLRPKDDIQNIRYFTSRMRGKRVARQRAYLRALETLPSVRVYLGRFKMRTFHVPGSQDTFQVPEEKQTDVHIAVRLLDDAYQDHCDHFVIVSGDSDLVPAIEIVKRRFPTKRVIVYVPDRSRPPYGASEIRRAADEHHTIPDHFNAPFLAQAQFPTRVPDGQGGFITKPTEWP